MGGSFDIQKSIVSLALEGGLRLVARRSRIKILRVALVLDGDVRGLRTVAPSVFWF